LQPSVFLFIDRFDQSTYRFRLIQAVGSDSSAPSVAHAPVILDAESHVDVNVDKQLHGVLDQVVGDVRAKSAMRGEQPLPSVSKESGALERLGRLLFTYVLPEPIQSALQELDSDASLILIAKGDRYPWEVLHDGKNYISLSRAFCRRVLVPKQIQAISAKTGSALKILLIANPTGDLPEADEEMMELLDMFDHFEPHVRATSIGVKRATKQKVLEAIASGEYGIIHYSGHARSDALLLADGELSGVELGKALQGTPFFFLNACESADTGLPAQPNGDLALSDLVAADLVKSAIQGGATGVLGTLWPVFDSNSRQFAACFYSQILRGIPLGEAVRQTRGESAKAFPDDLLWASYVLYGEPTMQWLIPESKKIRTITVLVAHNESLLRQFDGLENEAEMAFQLYDAFEKSVLQHGGQAVRIRRGVWAGYWGVNQVFDNQGVRALQTAERLRIDFDGLLAGSSGNYQSPLKPSFGICTGDAVVRSRKMLIGPQWYSHDYVSGDAVALSERAHEGEILVDKDTHTLVQRVYAFEQIKDDEPKQSIAFRVKGIVDVLPPLIPLIGRESELSDLRKYYADSVTGRGAVVGLTGAAGIGKTRLVQQFYSKHVGEKTLWLKAHCQPSDQTSPYAVLAQIISQLAGFSAQDDGGMRAGKIQQMCQQFASDMRQPEARVEECGALLGMAIGISHTNQKSAYTDPETKQRQLVRLVQGLVAHRTEKTPVVLVLEDMQWIDEASFTVIEKLVKTAGQWRLLVLVLYRPDWRHDWAQLDFYHHIGLDELSEADSAGFVQTLLNASETPKEVVKAILSFAGGNPFYVEEVVKALLDGGFLQQSADVWTLTNGWETVANPKSIHNTIRMRVQRLPEPVQKIVGEATVVGQEFEYQLLDEVKGELAETDLGDALDVLSRRRFITLLEGWRSTAFYEFHHGLIWKSIYDDLVQSTKARLHRLVGLALLRLYRDESKRELWMRAVGHFYLGDDRIRAITYCLQFAQESAEVWANQIALHWYSRAIEKIATFDEQLPSADEVSQGATDEQLLSWSVQARIGAADVNAVLDRNDEAIVGYNDALSLLNEMGDGAREKQAGLYLNIAKACERKGTYADAQRALDSGLRIVSPTDGGNLGQLHVWRGMIHFRLGELQDALDACEMGISYLELDSCDLDTSFSENAIK